MCLSDHESSALDEHVIPALATYHIRQVQLCQVPHLLLLTQLRTHTSIITTAAVIRRNPSSASDSAYSYTFLCSVTAWSVVCHIRAPCLNRSTDLDGIWQIHLWDPMTHCARWGPWAQGRGDLRVKPPAKTCNCKLLLPPGEYRQKVILPLTKLLWCLILTVTYRYVFISPKGSHKIKMSTY